MEFGYLNKNYFRKLEVKKWEDVSTSDIGKYVFFKDRDGDIYYGKIEKDYYGYTVRDLAGDTWDNAICFAEDIYNIKSQFENGI